MHHSSAMPYFPNLHIFLYFQSSLRSSDGYCEFEHGYRRNGMERIVGWNGVSVAMIKVMYFNWIDYILYRNKFRHPLKS